MNLASRRLLRGTKKVAGSAGHPLREEKYEARVLECPEEIEERRVGVLVTVFAAGALEDQPASHDIALIDLHRATQGELACPIRPFV
jgi:hypothetical protein